MNRWMNRGLLLVHQFLAGIRGLVLATFFGMAFLGVDSPALADTDIAEAEPIPAEAPASAEVVSPKADDENQKDAKDEGSDKGKKDEKPKKKTVFLQKNCMFLRCSVFFIIRFNFH